MPWPIRKADWALALALFAALPAAAGTLEDGAFIRTDDEVRLAGLDAAAGGALRGALAEGAPADLAVLIDGLEGAAMRPETALALLPGEWECRMLKLGGGLALVVYAPFRCRAGADGRFEKLTGSQRTLGALHSDAGRLVYLGTGFVAGETPPDYTNLPEAVDPQAVPQFMPEVGLVEITGPDRGRIIFPRPYLESDLNLLLLRR